MSSQVIPPTNFEFTDSEKDSNLSNICNICYDPIGQTNSTTTPCGHQFCFKCIIKAYQRNPSCPYCRTPLNETDEEIEDEEEEVASGYNPTPWREYPWREGRTDFENPEDGGYHFPAIIETVNDIHRVMCVTGSYGDEARIHILMHLMDPSYKFGDGIYDEIDFNVNDANLKDLCAMEGLSTFRIAFNIYKHTQMIKKFAEKHIQNQRRGGYPIPVRFDLHVIKTQYLDDWLGD